MRLQRVFGSSVGLVDLPAILDFWVPEPHLATPSKYPPTQQQLAYLNKALTLARPSAVRFPGPCAMLIARFPLAHC